MSDAKVSPCQSSHLEQSVHVHSLDVKMWKLNVLPCSHAISFKQTYTLWKLDTKYSNTDVVTNV